MEYFVVMITAKVIIAWVTIANRLVNLYVGDLFCAKIEKSIFAILALSRSL